MEEPSENHLDLCCVACLLLWHQHVDNECYGREGVGHVYDDDVGPLTNEFWVEGVLDGRPVSGVEVIVECVDWGEKGVPA